MKSMKKFAAIALAVVLAAGLLTACGGSSSNQPAGSGAASGGSSNVLRMVTEATFPPYEFYEGEDIVGIDVEIAKAIAESLGMELQVEDIAFDSIITSVQTGKADVGIAGLTITEDRLQNVAFSEPYANAVQVVILPEGSAVKSVGDLAGKKIAVQTGTTGDIYASDIENAQIEQFTKATDAVLALSSGKVDAMIIDSAPAAVYVQENPGLKILEEDFANEEYAIAVSKDNTELLEKINKALADLKASGKLDEIVAKYISSK